MIMKVPALYDYGNAWVGQYMYLFRYMDCRKEGDFDGMENALDYIMKHVETTEEYQKSFGIAFEPDFTESQKRRINRLAVLYNEAASEDNPDVDMLYRIAKIPVKLIKKWANPARESEVI
ncbi:MAG: hypothetical protein JW789_02915 [Candidatus Aenigmarchaeota archaeon]|nr:hypothetical protein [Candidatus Aenigmarchaeota archaeon]